MTSKPEPFLQTERLVLRALKADDAEALIPAWTDSDTARFMDDFGPRSADEVGVWTRESIDAFERDPGFFGWVFELKSDGQVVGWLGLGPDDRGVGDIDLAYVVSPAHRGRGYCSEALRRVIRFCFDDLGVDSVWAQCHVDNAASARVMTSSGMVPIGIVDGQSRHRVSRR